LALQASSQPEKAGEPGAGVSGETARSFLTLIIALTFLMNTVARGVTETFAVFLLPVQHGIEATRAEMTGTYAVLAVSYALAAPFVGQVIDRLGMRATYGFGLIVLGSGYVLASLVTEPWQYYLAVGLCGGLGSAALGMIVASSILARWFTRRMGSIVSLPYAAIGAGMLIVPPLTQLLVESSGWRTAHLVLGLVTLAFLPFVMVMPLGKISAGSAEWQAARRAQVEGTASRWSVGAAMRTSAFWGLAWAYFCTSVAAYSVLPQSVAYLIEKGFNPLLAASAFGMTGALSAVGIIAVGWLSDRFGRLPTVTITYLMSVAGALSLLLITVWPSLVLVYGFVVLFGLVQGARGPIIVALVSKLFRGGAVGGIFGTLSIAMGLGQATGSFVSGLLQQSTGGYVASFGLGIVGSLLGCLTFWVVPGLRRERIEGTDGA
jgi:MFS family permease